MTRPARETSRDSHAQNKQTRDKCHKDKNTHKTPPTNTTEKRKIPPKKEKKRKKKKERKTP
jgi:hypothetical protein